MSKYQTISKATEITYTEKGSKFIAYMEYSDSLGCYKKRLKELKTLHISSNHVCSAYRIYKKDILEEDRIAILLRIRDLTFPEPENKLILKCTL